MRSHSEELVVENDLTVVNVIIDELLELVTGGNLKALVVAVKIVSTEEGNLEALTSNGIEIAVVIWGTMEA